MNSLVNIIATLLIVLWAIGYFACDIGEGIHIVLVLAVISVFPGIAEANKHHINN